MFKMEVDPRIFPFGHKLRDWSIDEYYHSMTNHKTGITGLWQVSGRSDITDFEEVVVLDMKYIQDWSFSEDIKILAKTVKVVLKREGGR